MNDDDFYSYLAEKMLEDAQGVYIDYRHKGRKKTLIKVLKEHNNVSVHSCKDEYTGKRFGKAKCRVGRCIKLGHTTNERQYWAVWE